MGSEEFSPFSRFKFLVLLPGLKWFSLTQEDKKLSLKLSLECLRGEGHLAARQGQRLSRGNLQFSPRLGPLGLFTAAFFGKAF